MRPLVYWKVDLVTLVPPEVLGPLDVAYVCFVRGLNEVTFIIAQCYLNFQKKNYCTTLNVLQ